MDYLKKIIRKAIVLFTCFLVFSTSFSINQIVAEEKDSSSQISNYYNSDGEIVGTDYKEYENGDLKLYKTISATNKENEFDIDLKVTSKRKAASVKKAEDAAVVLVLDVSTSLSDSDRNTIMDTASSFVDSFGTSSNGKARYISIVTFCQNIKATG